MSFDRAGNYTLTSQGQVARGTYHYWRKDDNASLLTDGTISWSMTFNGIAPGTIHREIRELRDGQPHVVATEDGTFTVD